MQRKFDIDIPLSQIAAAVGSKEFVVTTPQWMKLRTPSRDTVLFPAVSYPSYAMGATLSGCRPVAVPMTATGGIDLTKISQDDAKRALMIWMNSPSNPSGALDDMGAVVAWGRKHDVPVFSDVVEGGLRDPRRTVYVGARDIDDGEREIVERWGCRIFTPEEIARIGPERAIDEAMAIACGTSGRCSVSFDLDSLDPSIAPGVDCHVPGGLDWRTAEVILARIGASNAAVAVEVVEVNPSADPSGKTARLAVEAAALLCGV
jgi:hypothetical protein